MAHRKLGTSHLIRPSLTFPTGFWPLPPPKSRDSSPFCKGAWSPPSLSCRVFSMLRIFTACSSLDVIAPGPILAVSCPSRFLLQVRRHDTSTRRPAPPAPLTFGGCPRPALPQGRRRQRATAWSTFRARHAPVGPVTRILNTTFYIRFDYQYTPNYQNKYSIYWKSTQN